VEFLVAVNESWWAKHPEIIHRIRDLRKLV